MPRVKARAQFNTSFEDLHHKYGISKSTLCGRARDMQSRQKAHEDYQALPPAMEDVLKKWALRMDSQGFPPRLDIFKAVAKNLFQQQLDNSNDSELKTLGPTWLRSFLNRNPTISVCYSTPMYRQHVFANRSSPIKDYFKKLKAITPKYRILEENMWNMDEKGFTLGTANRSKVIARAGRQPPRTTLSGT